MGAMIHVQLLFRRMGMRVVPWGKRGFILGMMNRRRMEVVLGVVGGLFSVAVPVGARHCPRVGLVIMRFGIRFASWCHILTIHSFIPDKRLHRTHRKEDPVSHKKSKIQHHQTVFLRFCISGSGSGQFCSGQTASQLHLLRVCLFRRQGPGLPAAVSGIHARSLLPSGSQSSE